jgi:hypothetical protein
MPLPLRPAVAELERRRGTKPAAPSSSASGRAAASELPRTLHRALNDSPFAPHRGLGTAAAANILPPIPPLLVACSSTETVDVGSPSSLSRAPGVTGENSGACCIDSSSMPSFAGSGPGGGAGGGGTGFSGAARISRNDGFDRSGGGSWGRWSFKEDCCRPRMVDGRRTAAYLFKRVLVNFSLRVGEGAAGRSAIIM